MRWYAIILVVVGLVVAAGSFLVAEQLRRPTWESLGIRKGQSLAEVEARIGRKPSSHSCFMGWIELAQWKEQGLQAQFLDGKLTRVRYTTPPTLVERAWNWLHESILGSTPEPDWDSLVTLAEPSQ